MDHTKATELTMTIIATIFVLGSSPVASMGGEFYVVKVGTMRGVENTLFHTLYYDDAPTDRIPLHRGH